MKFLKKSFFLYLFLALVFSVVVSGGCGGGGGSHYSGDFGQDQNSIQDFSPEPENQDIPEPENQGVINNDLSDPVPDEPAISDQFGNDDSDSDEYGANQMDNGFNLLHRTVWKIESYDIVATSGPYQGEHLERSYLSINANPEIDNDDPDIKIDSIQDRQKFAFLISGDFILWAEPVDRKTYPSNNLIIYSRSPDGKNISAPFFRNSNKFKKDEDKYSYKASFSDSWGGSEQIEFSETSETVKKYPVAKSLIITNNFRADGNDYKCTVDLTIDLLASLNQTSWMIKDIKIADASKDYGANSFPVDLDSLNPDTSKLTLFISDDLIKSDDEFIISNLHLIWADGNNAKHYKRDNSDILCGIFTDTVRNGKALYAHFLRPTSNMTLNRIDTDNGYHIYESASKDELVYISDYGPNAELTINNFCAYSVGIDNYNASFWATLTLEPYNPNKAKDSLFSKLNGTGWVIESAHAYWYDDASGKYIENPVSKNKYNYNTDKLTFITTPNEMTWRDGKGKFHYQESQKNVWLDDNRWLTLTAFDKARKSVSVPILRTASGFKQTRNSKESVTYEAPLKRRRYRNNGTAVSVNSGTEAIKITKNNFPSQVTITNTFNFNDDPNKKCITVLNLNARPR